MLYEFLHRVMLIQIKGKTVILKRNIIYRFLYDEGFFIGYNVFITKVCIIYSQKYKNVSQT